MKHLIFQHKKLILATCIGYLFTPPTLADNVLTGNIKTSANVVTNCSVQATDLAFGEYTGDNDLTATNTITVNCQRLSDYSISINAGMSGNLNNRKMKGASEQKFLPYNIYTDNTYTTIWGDGTGGTGVISDQGKQGGDYMAYGKIPAGYRAPVDSYSDTLTVTVNF